MSPTLFTLDPTVINATRVPVHTFANSTALTGIAEYQPGVFAVVASVLNTTTRRTAPGSVVIWSVDFNSRAPAVHTICSLPHVTGANGISFLPDLPDTLLAADSASGAVWQINTRTGGARLAIEDPSMAPGGPAPALGINGLHADDGFLYFTNSQLDTFSRVRLAVEDNTVKAAGDVEELVEGLAGQNYDDFVIDSHGRAWVTAHPGALSLLFPVGNGRWDQLNAAGNSQGLPSILVQPTSSAFGRGPVQQKKILYVTTGGGQVVGVDTSG
jgi:sugar lactone lactonase YvrE